MDLGENKKGRIWQGQETKADGDHDEQLPQLPNGSSSGSYCGKWMSTGYLSGTKQAALLQAALKQLFQWIPTFRGRDIFWCMRKNCSSQTAQSTVIGVANSYRKYSQTLLTPNFRSLSQRDLLLHVAQYSPAEYLARWARRPWGTFPSWLAGWGCPEKEQGLH